jgi:LysM repeat protein
MALKRMNHISMDSISRENNETSYLPIAALIVGLLAGIFAAVAFFKVNTVAKSMEGQAAMAARVQELEGQVRTAVATSEKATERITKVASDTNAAFGQVGEAIGGIRTELAKVQEDVVKPKAAASSGGSAGGAAPTAGAGEYVVKGGDTGSKIARAAGVSLSDLLTVNPGVNWNRLNVGQVVRLPAK